MAFSGGTFSLIAGNPVTTGTTISSTSYNNTLSDIAANGLTLCVLKDGSQTITANLPMSSFKLTGLAAGSTSGDSVRYEQVLLLAGGTMTGALKCPDNLMQIVGSSDATKIAVFEVDGLTTATTRTYTLQNSSDTIVGRATTDTLTNKTLTSPVINTQVSGTAIAAQSDMDAGTSAVLIVTPSMNFITLMAEQASTSGTSIDFTSIPAGTRRITIMFVGVSTNGTSAIQVQIGDSGGPENTNYLGSGTIMSGGVISANYTAGFGVANAGAATAIYHGQIIISLERASTFQWVESGVIGESQQGEMHVSAGSKALSDTLTQVRITTVNGTDAFDAGVINVSYER